MKKLVFLVLFVLFFSFINVSAQTVSFDTEADYKTGYMPHSSNDWQCYSTGGCNFYAKIELPYAVYYSYLTVNVFKYKYSTQLFNDAIRNVNDWRMYNTYVIYNKNNVTFDFAIQPISFPDEGYYIVSFTAPNEKVLGANVIKISY